MDKIIGQSIKTVLYSEVNNHNGPFYYNGFDTFDHAINIQMKNGFWWHLAWKNDEFFEFGPGYFEKNTHLNISEIKQWEATERWKNILGYSVTNFDIVYLDKTGHIPSRIKITFQKNKSISILIAPELNLDKSLPELSYNFSGHLYVFHNNSLLK